ncbi:hypothetical protein BpHYR1_008371 [Brachionus plicatilis]|uniref:Uncharacterized protein n=1 Tax=Brachionus plicatilis TaxID=10195 RepID=A0A3M7S828_BRAPC|nr:hypothetical protein BpHYR1_008371 [Brachionus plicatilis]
MKKSHQRLNFFMQCCTSFERATLRNSVRVSVLGLKLFDQAGKKPISSFDDAQKHQTLVLEVAEYLVGYRLSSVHNQPIGNHHALQVILVVSREFYEKGKKIEGDIDLGNGMLDYNVSVFDNSLNLDEMKYLIDVIKDLETFKARYIVANIMNILLIYIIFYFFGSDFYERKKIRSTEMSKENKSTEVVSVATI